MMTPESEMDSTVSIGLKKRRLKVHYYPDPVLHKDCAPVAIFDKKLQTFAERMFRCMKKNKGIGLAAPQVGVLYRVVVIGSPDADLFLVNPEIVASSPDCAALEEGCLSLPDKAYDVDRHIGIEVKARTINGKGMHFDAYELLARVIQHEVDHLDGVLICDRATAAAD